MSKNGIEHYAGELTLFLSGVTSTWIITSILEHEWITRADIIELLYFAGAAFMASRFIADD